VLTVGPGTRLLDAGCGAGGARTLAASRGARVNGLDAATALVTIARQRVADGDFRVGDVQALPYADETFDAIIAADVLPYVADPLVAMHELRRVCAPHGRVAAAILAAPEEYAHHAVFMAVRALLPRPLDVQPFALSAPGVLDALIGQAGLRVLGGGMVACPSVYPDTETFWQAQASAGLLQAAVRVVGSLPLMAALLRAVAPYQTDTGDVCLHNTFHYIVTSPPRAYGRLTQRMLP
jgi:SAM-dependent methyltransferase